MALRRIRQTLIGGARPREDAILVLGNSTAQIEAAGAIIDTLTDGRFRISVVLVSGTGDRDELARRFPGAEVRRPLFMLGPFCALTLKLLRARVTLVLDAKDLGGNVRRLFDGSIRRGISVYGLEVGHLAALASGGLPPSELSLLSHAAPPDPAPLDAASLAWTLGRAIGVVRDPDWSLDRFARRVAESPLRVLLRPILTRIDTVEALEAHLGHPRSIMCLGNGPTSIDPALETLGPATLFRVNHDWRAKGYLSRPDMVFAGVKRSMRKLGRTTLGVATKRKEDALIACRAFEPWHGPATYSVVEQIAAGTISPVPGSARPTSGAYMLAAAIALQPDRLIVAGMDMFRHPDGTYADGGSEINAYTPGHDFQTDVEFITQCLGAYRGKLITFSPAIADLARSVPRARFTLECADQARH